MGEIHMDTFDLVSHINNKDDGYSVIWLFNIGVEKYWNNLNNDVVASKEDEIVNSSEEMMLLLARKQDIVIMRKKTQNAYMELLEKLGIVSPMILIPKGEDSYRCISEIVLEDDDLLKRLKIFGEKNNVVFFPYGVSSLEERIAEVCNLKLIGESEEKSRKINNKIYAREIAEELGFKTSEGYTCSTIEEMVIVYNKLKEKYNRIIVKTPCNASGKGMWIVDDNNRLKVVSKIISRYMRSNEDASWLVEGWLEKEMDINIQIYVSEDGRVEVFSIKEQITEDTVYIGSVFQPRMTQEQYILCYEWAKKIGRYLFEHSFWGIFGVDGLITKSGQIVPIIEINGRCTLSTYVSFLANQFGKKYFFSFYKRAFSQKTVDYEILSNTLNNKGLSADRNKSGLFLYTPATLDSRNYEKMIRVFCVACGDTVDEIFDLKTKFDLVCAELKICDL